MRRLSGLDAAFLYMETPTTHLHVGGFGVFEPTGESPESIYERTIRTCEQRLHLNPVFRQRPVSVPFQIHHPVLADDPDFDIENHVRRVALPSPGGSRELAAAVGGIMSRPLDRHRPLWELHLIEGLEDGSVASVTKMHHAIVDGIAGVELAMLLLDLERDPPEPTEPPPPFEPEQTPTNMELLGHGLWSRLKQPFGVLSVAVAVEAGRGADRSATPPTPARPEPSSGSVRGAEHIAQLFDQLPARLLVHVGLARRAEGDQDRPRMHPQRRRARRLRGCAPLLLRAARRAPRPIARVFRAGVGAHGRLG